MKNLGFLKKNWMNLLVIIRIMINRKIHYRQIRFLVSLIVVLVSVSFPVFPGIVFSDLDLAGPASPGADNLLLFRAGAGNASGSAAVSAQDAVFLSRLPAAGTAQGNRFALRQLTAFPEKIELLENGQTLQIRNAFGAVRVPVSGGLPAPIPGFPSFAGGNPAALSGRAEEMALSADGRWLLYMEPVSPALGNLVMLDVQTSEKIQVASGLDRPEKVFPASWNPDSRFFIYERGGKLYYYTAGPSVTPVDEKTRLIGEGTISSIFWGRGGDFFYLRDATLFLVRGAELFARTIYADFLDIGIVVKKLPFGFDPGFDLFWVAPDSRSLLVSKGRRSLFYFPLAGADNGALRTVLPFFMLPRSCSEIKVLWPAGGPVTVLVSVPENSGTQVSAWRLNLADTRGASFESLPPPASGIGSFAQVSLSPDGSMVVFWGRGGILLYDYVNWKRLAILSAVPGHACLWAGNNELITGDDQKIERIRLPPRDSAGLPQNVSSAGRELICLSRAGQFGFEEGSLRVLAKSGNAWFVSGGRDRWTEINNPRVKNSSQVSAQYRVYLERQGPGLYANLPMLRNMTSVGTFSLFPPESGTPRRNASLVQAAHLKAALCFDLYDDDRGLPEVLEALNRYGVKATFFLNGEFIRRHPQLVSELSSAGHEIASMFFALIDLSDARYQTGPDFITQGLARNEDEYYRVTGKELTLLWHPPYYVFSRDIAAAAAKTGYVTAGRDVDPMDWVSRDDGRKLGLSRRSSSEMIDKITAELRPGSIIPVRLGLLPGGGNDYLFSRINVLIDAIVREGYTLTSVSSLMEYRAERKLP